MFCQVATRRMGACAEAVTRFQASMSSFHPKSSQNPVQSVNGTRPSNRLFVVSRRQFVTTPTCFEEASSKISQQIESMVKNADVVIFMKGVPEAPRCGFSNAVCQIMRMHEVPFESHDVLADEELRQGGFAR